MTNELMEKIKPRTRRLLALSLGCLLLGSLSATPSARASSSLFGSEYELVQSLLTLARSNLKDAADGIVLVHQFLDGFTATIDKPMQPVKKADVLLNKLSGLERFVAANSRSIPKWFFDYTDHEIKTSRLALTRYQFYTKYPKISGSKAKADYWLAETRKHSAWAAGIALSLKPFVLLDKASTHL